LRKGREEQLVALYNPRTKSITFRISPDEYEAVKGYCLDKRMRVSELAREATLQQVVSTPSQRTFVSADLMALSSGLDEIDGALKQLSDKISKVLGPK
jgi:hypothetical protein